MFTRMWVELDDNWYISLHSIVTPTITPQRGELAIIQRLLQSIIPERASDLFWVHFKLLLHLQERSEEIKFRK